MTKHRQNNSPEIVRSRTYRTHPNCGCEVDVTMHRITQRARQPSFYEYASTRCEVTRVVHRACSPDHDVAPTARVHSFFSGT